MRFQEADVCVCVCVSEDWIISTALYAALHVGKGRSIVISPASPFIFSNICRTRFNIYFDIIELGLRSSVVIVLHVV